MAILIPPEILLGAYRQGVFPMALAPGDIRWFSPDPRGILPLDQFRIPHGARGALKDPAWEIRIDTCFETVVRACGCRADTWIDEVIVASYSRLFEIGHAHSVEVWREGRLAGGLYGVSIGGVFFGESMFHHVSHASKVALAALVGILRAGGYAVLDIQWTTPHLQRFGATDIPRSEYRRMLAGSLDLPVRFEWNGVASGCLPALGKRFTHDDPTHHDRLMVGPDSPVNWEQLDMIADGYAEDFVEIYREFEKDLPRIVGEVRRGLDAGDAAQAAHAAHQAKGSAANFGFFGFSSVMGTIEDASRIGNLTGLDAELVKAEGLFQESLALVKRERNI